MNIPEFLESMTDQAKVQTEEGTFLLNSWFSAVEIYDVDRLTPEQTLVAKAVFYEGASQVLLCLSMLGENSEWQAMLKKEIELFAERELDKRAPLGF